MQQMSTNGFAVSDVLTELSKFANLLKLPPPVKAILLDKLCDIE